MPSGLGVSPLGTGPYGYGTPDGTAPSGGNALTGDNGVRFGSRKIDPTTGQYVYDEFGRAVGMSNMQQQVLLAVKTALGSSADPTLGDSTYLVQDIGRNFEAQLKSKLQDALAHLTSAGLIEILSIDVVRTGESGAFRHLRWKDLTTGTEDEATLP